ncbi:3D (Asp-Asp-Asp) domain-containing protein [Paenibacillus sp. DS2015]|uniref:3D domain-containing protein n=1 Tax=Paenibacillus sp. DS2015 TaxID=3373917 RepID=UPI003D21269B
MKKFSTIKIMTAIIGISAAMQVAPVHADQIHVATAGDTFYSLTKEYKVDLNKMIQANPKVSATNIYEGMNLSIPTSSTVVKQSVASAATPITAKQVSTTSLLNVIPEDSKVEAWGKVFNYSKTINVKASAYSAAASENGKWGAVDYFGNPLKLGTLAVDPSIIPLGTKVLVTGHNHAGLPKQAFVATAKDVGSAIKGHRIDIFIPGSQATVRDFGYQNVELYIIK